MNYTKGNWKNNGYGFVKCGVSLIADCINPNMNANAQLISAAPELLKACKEVAAWLDSEPLNVNSQNYKAFIILQQAINKAEGKE